MLRSRTSCVPTSGGGRSRSACSSKVSAPTHPTRSSWKSLPVTRCSASISLDLAPAACPVVRDDLPEHVGQGLSVDLLALLDSHCPGRLVVVTGCDDALRVGDDTAVV